MELKTSFKKDLSWFDCSSIIVGIMIGTGIFSTFPTLIAQHNISTLMILLAWFFGGVFAWFGAMCYAELCSIFPYAGGDYMFLRKAYSAKGENVVSFLFAWTEVLVIRPASIATLSLILANELNKILYVSGGPGKTLFIAVATVSLLTLINILGITIGKNVQNSITMLKMAVLLFIIVFGLSHLHINYTNLSPVIIPPDKNPYNILVGFWSALVLSMWVFGGWNEAVYIAEEAKNSAADIAKALFFGIFSVAILYVGINFIYVQHFTPAGLAHTYTPASDLMGLWFGSKGGIIMALIIILSAAGAINGLTMTGGRMTYAIAKDYDRLTAFAQLHKSYRTPEMALIANLLITVILLFLSKGHIRFVENLTFYTAGVFWYFFALVIIGLMLLRREIANENIPYKVPFYPFLPVLFLLITISLIWGSVKYKPVETLSGIALLMAGIPIYYILQYKKIQQPPAQQGQQSPQP